MTDQPKARLLPPALAASDLDDYAAFAGGGRNRSADSALDPGLQQKLATERREQGERIAQAAVRAVKEPKEEGKAHG